VWYHDPSGHGLQIHAEPAKNRLSDEGQSAPGRAPDARLVGRDRRLQAAARGRSRPAALDPARWAPVRQRQHPHGPRAQQGDEGSRGEVTEHARLQRRLRARLGLPRAAHRAPGRPGARARHRADRRSPRHGSAREDRKVSRVRRALRPGAARGVQAPRGLRRLGQPLHHDGAGLPGGDRARVRTLRGAWTRLQGPQAGALVHALQDGPRAGRGRVRGPADALGLRALPADRVAAVAAGAREALAGDLDHHAVDAAGQPRDRGASGRGVRRPGGRRARRWSGSSTGTRGSSARAGWPPPRRS
jgi:hypothetical protein